MVGATHIGKAPMNKAIVEGKVGGRLSDARIELKLDVGQARRSHGDRFHLR